MNVNIGKDGNVWIVKLKIQSNMLIHRIEKVFPIEFDTNDVPNHSGSSSDRQIVIKRL